jgi:hypothetical protein
MKKLNMLLTRFLVPTLLLGMLAACGGGNGPGGAPMGGGNANGEITLRLTDGSGREIISIPSGGTGIVTASVTDAFGDAPSTSVLVNFTIGPTTSVGTLSSSAVATDTSGNASVTLTAGTSGESGQVTATATLSSTSGTPISAKIAFNVQ